MGRGVEAPRLMWHLYTDSYLVTVAEPSDSATGEHQHHALQLSFGIDGPLTARIAGVEVGPHDGLLVGPDRDHAVDGACVMLMCEPEGPLGRQLLGRLRTEDFAAVTDCDPAALARLRASVGRTRQQPAAPGLRLPVVGHMLELIASLTDRCDPAPPLDPRVRRVIAHLFDTEGTRRPLAELASVVGLSPGRLRHLFVAEVGIPIRQYASWCRAVLALRRVGEDSSLTEAAHAAGFADQAAFSRAHRKLFGRKPSVFHGEAKSAV